MKGSSPTAGTTISARTTATSTLGLPENTNATFTIRTYQGSISTDFTLEGYNRGGAQRGRRVTATLGNGSADVSLETLRRIDQAAEGVRGDGRAGGRRRLPALRAERLLQPLRPLDQGVGVGVMLDLLAAIRKCNDKFVIVTIRLAPDFVQQPRVVTLEKPNHAACLSVCQPRFLRPRGLAAQRDHRLDPRCPVCWQIRCHGGNGHQDGRAQRQRPGVRRPHVEQQRAHAPRRAGRPAAGR